MFTVRTYFSRIRCLFVPRHCYMNSDLTPWMVECSRHTQRYHAILSMYPVYPLVSILAALFIRFLNPQALDDKRHSNSMSKKSLRNMKANR